MFSCLVVLLIANSDNKTTKQQDNKTTTYLPSTLFPLPPIIYIPRWRADVPSFVLVLTH